MQHAEALRLSRLEARLDVNNADLRRLTDDELSVKILDLSRCIAADPEAPAEVREDCQRKIVEIEDGIRRQALARLNPGYEKHLAKVAGDRFPEYVPCTCCWADADPGMMEYHDLDKPRIMERRAAILARPDVQILIAKVGVAGHA